MNHTKPFWLSSEGVVVVLELELYEMIIRADRQQKDRDRSPSQGGDEAAPT